MGSSSLAGGRAQDAQPQQMGWLVRHEPEGQGWGSTAACTFLKSPCQSNVWCGEGDVCRHICQSKCPVGEGSHGIL